jgi:hypothetical protein
MRRALPQVARPCSIKLAGIVGYSSEWRATPSYFLSDLGALCLEVTGERWRCSSPPPRQLIAFFHFYAMVLFVNFDAFLQLLGFPGQEL